MLVFQERHIFYFRREGTRRFRTGKNGRSIEGGKISRPFAPDNSHRDYNCRRKTSREQRKPSRIRYTGSFSRRPAYSDRFYYSNNNDRDYNHSPQHTAKRDILYSHIHTQKVHGHSTTFQRPRRLWHSSMDMMIRMTRRYSGRSDRARDFHHRRQACLHGSGRLRLRYLTISA